MICKQCGEETPDGFVFCRHCGAKLDYSQKGSMQKPKNKKPIVVILGLIVLVAVVVFAGKLVKNAVKHSFEVKNASESMSQAKKTNEVIELESSFVTNTNNNIATNSVVEEVLKEVKELSDANEIVSNEQLRQIYKNQKINTGNVIKLGTYIQDGDKGTKKTSIEWKVVKIKNGEALLIAQHGLDCKPFNEYNNETYWERCTLRKWLNDEFYNTAFTEEEKKALIKHRVGTAKNKISNTRSGNPTYDYVAIPSEGELDSYLPTPNSRKAKASVYSVLRGAFASTEPSIFGNGYYWLRTGGTNRQFAMVVDPYGVADSNGQVVIANNIMVRPEIWVKVP